MVGVIPKEVSHYSVIGLRPFLMPDSSFLTIVYNQDRRTALSDKAPDWHV